MTSQVGIWDKVDAALAEKLANTGTGKAEEPQVERKRNFFLANILGYVIWTYVVVKLLIFDIDQYAFETFLPNYLYLLQYKFFVFLGIFTVVVILFPKYRLHLLYIAAFPLILVVWKIPRAIYRTRSWLVLLAVLNALASFASDFRLNLALKTLAIFAVLSIVVAQRDWLLILSALVLAGYLIIAYYRAVKFSLIPSRFLTLQQSFVKRLSDSDLLRNFIEVKSEFRSAQVQKLDQTQLATFTSNLSCALLASWFIYYWAYQLDSYRKSGATYLFGTLAYIWLFVQTIFVFSFVNLAFFKIDPSSFSYSSEPSFLVFVYYSLSALFVNGINALEPVGDWALVVKIAAGLTGPLLLATFLLNFVMTARQSRQDSGLRTIISDMKAQGAEFERRIQAEYEVSVEEALIRLQRLGGGFMGGLII